MADFIEEAINRIDVARVEARASLEHMRAQLARLNREYREATDALMRDNNDHKARRAMEQAEARIDRLKVDLAEKRRAAQQRLGDMRRALDARREAHLRELEQELAQLRGEQETLQSERIPQARAELDRLVEAKRSLDAKRLALTSRIGRLRQHELDVGLTDIE